MKRTKEKRGRRERCVQNEFVFERPGWGGRRKGAGRRRSPKSGVSHLKRQEFLERHPVHVSMKLVEGLPSLRLRENFLAVLGMFEKAQRENFRIVHFSVQGNHLHLIVEAEGREALSSGMRGLGVRMSRGLNKRWGREGTVFADRYHSRVLRTPTEVKRALNYVFKNDRRHRSEGVVRAFDTCSSSRLFDGWIEAEAMELAGELRPVVPARSWLIQRGWREAGGKLSLSGRPGPRRKNEKARRTTAS